MLRFALTAPIALALAACSSGADEVDADGDGTISREETQAAATKVRRLEAGEYKMAMELVELDDPTMSPEEVAQAKKFFSAMGGMSPSKCMTEEEANEGMVGIAEGMQKGDCTTDSMTADENGMRGTLTCQGKNGPAKVTMNSTSTGTEGEMSMRVVEPTSDGKEKTVAMKITMTRQGDCAAE